MSIQYNDPAGIDALAERNQQLLAQLRMVREDLETCKAQNSQLYRNHHKLLDKTARPVLAAFDWLVDRNPSAPHNEEPVEINLRPVHYQLRLPSSGLKDAAKDEELRRDLRNFIAAQIADQIMKMIDGEN